MYVYKKGLKIKNLLEPLYIGNTNKDKLKFLIDKIVYQDPNLFSVVDYYTKKGTYTSESRLRFVYQELIDISKCIKSKEPTEEVEYLLRKGDKFYVCFSKWEL